MEIWLVNIYIILSKVLRGDQIVKIASDKILPEIKFWIQHKIIILKELKVVLVSKR